MALIKIKLIPNGQLLSRVPVPPEAEVALAHAVVEVSVPKTEERRPRKRVTDLFHLEPKSC